MRTTILLDHGPYPGGHVVRAMLKLAGDAPAAAHRAPLNLSLVLDRSGSMSGEKLEAAREAAALLVRRLGLADVVSVVAYDQAVTVISEPGTAATQPDLAARITQIHSGGSTNLSGGWLRGREFVKDRREAAGVNRVILLTDGLANVGIQDPEQLTRMCGAAKREGITTTTIGFGADYDEVLLRGMADAGGGNTYYIESPDQAAAIFNDELEGLLGIAAQNVRVEVRVAPDVVLAQVHHQYPSAQQAGVLTLELGDLYPREPKSLLCEFHTSDVLPLEPLALATLRVTADVVRDDGIEHVQLELPITVSLHDGPQVDPEVQKELLLLEAARVRRDALDAARAGDYAAGERMLREARAKFEAFGLEDMVLREQSEDLAASAELYAACNVSAADRKYLYQRSYNVASGRSMKDALIRRKRRPE